MASGHSGDAIRQINRLFGAGTVVGLTDGQLLDRFATRRGEAAELAFEALVIRHGPMVLRVARGMLRDPHDVEDAFQATFLVLVRRAGSIGEREQLGPWLYGVALRVSKKARTLAARRGRREGGMAEDPPTVESDAAWLDTRPILHEELGRLPDKYRKPVILCHLQGLTHAEAAQELAWPVGTVSVRLARARKLLRERLTRRGLTATAALWGAGLASESASAAVPQALIQSTLKAAIAYAAGKTFAAGAVSAGALMLTRGVLMMMFLSKLKWVAVPMLVGVGTAGAVVIADVGPPESQVTEKPASDTQSAVRTGAGSASSQHALPPGFFDFPPREKKDGTAPLPIIKPGQIVQVEVLIALPGRPISGERLVRADGTIGLGFYGDLPVAGLNRIEAKIKLIEHLRKYLSDDDLGLASIDLRNQELVFTPPAESNRVFIADDLDFPRHYEEGAGSGGVKVGQVVTVETLEALPGRPITGERVVGPDGRINLGFYGDVHVLGLDRTQIKVKVIEHLRRYLTDETLGLIEVDKHGNRNVIPPAESSRVFIDDAILPSGARTAEAVQQLRAQVKDLNIKLDRVLKELEAMRPPAEPAEAKKVQP